LYEERKRAEAKKQDQRKSQVRGGVPKRGQKGKKVVQFEDIDEGDLDVEELMPRNG